MAVGSTARQYPWQLVHYLRRKVSFESGSAAIPVGVIPAGALIVKPMSGVQVVTAFNSGTNKQCDVGFTDGSTTDADYFGTDLSLSAAGFVPLDETVGLYRVANDSTITVTLDLTGTAATAGEADVIICYIPDNDH